MVSELSVHAVHLDEMRVLAESGSRKVLTDYPLTQGQPIEGLTSLELLLASLATCATNSVLALLKRKMKQSVTGLDVYARGLQCEEHPTVLTEISLEFVISGKVDPEAVRKVSENLCRPALPGLEHVERHDANQRDVPYYPVIPEE